MNQLAPHPIPTVIKALYAEQDKLKKAFPQHAFALDGNLIGNMGEVIAEMMFDLEKLPGNHSKHDMRRRSDGVLVQVKTTQKAAAFEGVGLGTSKTSFTSLLVLELDKDGTFEILYYGPGSIIDEKRHHKKGASLSRKQLRECREQLEALERTEGPRGIAAAV